MANNKNADLHWNAYCAHFKRLLPTLMKIDKNMNITMKREVYTENNQDKIL